MSCSLLPQIAMVLLFLWNTSVVTSVPIYGDQFRSSTELEDNIIPDDQLSRNLNYWNKDILEKGEFILPSIYELNKHLERNSLNSDRETMRADGFLKDEATSNDNGDQTPLRSSVSEFEPEPSSWEWKEGNGRRARFESSDEMKPYFSFGVTQARGNSNMKGSPFYHQKVIKRILSHSPDLTGPIELYKTFKRSPMCLKKCMLQGLLHPAQCHSLC